MTRYRKALRAFQFRYVLGAALRHDGNLAAAAREIGICANRVREILLNGGLRAKDIRGMVINGALLRAGLPPRKPVASELHAAIETRRTA